MVEKDAQKVLERSIEHAASRVLEGKLPAVWAGEQLVALIRHWGYLGYDWEMPETFSQFDLVMTDLECFPDGRMTRGWSTSSQPARDVLGDGPPFLIAPGSALLLWPTRKSLSPAGEPTARRRLRTNLYRTLRRPF